MSVFRKSRKSWVVLPVLLATSWLLASTPAVWEHPSRFSAGPGPAVPIEREGRHAEGVSIAETGALTLSVPLREVFPAEGKITPPPILWTASLDQGGNLFLGAGNTGEVFRIDRKGTTVSSFDTNELGARALASSVTGDLYVGTFPGGAVYKIDPAGKAEPWFDPEDRYIWAMAIDNSGSLFVATGERGVVYQVFGKSQAKPIFRSEEAHITALAFDKSSRLIAGTAPSGLLYRLGTDGKTETLLDSGLNEISAVAVAADGTIYAASIGEETPQSVRRPGEKNDMTIEVTPAPDGNILEEEADQPRKITINLEDLQSTRVSAGEGAASRIYRLEPGRAAALAWRSETERVFSMAWTRERGLVFGTGGTGGSSMAGGADSGGAGEGRIYRLEPDGSATLLHQLREPQVTNLLANPDGRIYACTSNPGHVYVLDNGTSPSGAYLSSVYDAGHVAQWGSIAWDADIPAGTRIEITTRSGNRPTPDSTWSAWSPPYSQERGSQVASPASRYVQWKAEMSRLKTDAAPTLRRVKVTLLADNRPPVLRGLRVLEAGAGWVKPSASFEKAGAEKMGADKVGAEKTGADKTGADKSTPEKNEPPKGSRWVTWTSSDPDDDLLSHTIWLKRSEESDFKRVADQIAAGPYALQEASLAEGRYQIKVQVDDARTNGTQRALDDAEISDQFVVDHTPPRLELKQTPGAGTGRLKAEISAVDAVGTIARAEISTTTPGESAANVNVLPCRDGICDTSTEGFLIDLPDPGAGHQVTVRVFDAAGNSATVEIPGGKP
ncbi:MAG TPA: hypothetical protein VFE84_13640 [Patescibacteria group bacterium]|nr:hypothetical protein [Patescibacteria group bacterium]